MFSPAHSQAQLASCLTHHEAKNVWAVDPDRHRYVRVSSPRACDVGLVGYTESASGERLREFYVTPDDPYPGVGTPSEACDPRTLDINQPGRQTLRSWYGPEICKAEGIADDTVPAESPTDELIRMQMESRWADDIDCDDFQWMSSNELDAGNFDLAYHIDGLLVEGQPCILAGPKKSLKTNILIDLTISLAAGEAFLGRFPVNRKYRVGIMSGESGKATIQETARRVCAAKMISLRDVHGVRWCFDLPEFGSAADYDKLNRFLTGLDAVMIDPAYLCLPLGDDAGNLFKVGPLLREIAEQCEQAGCTPLIAHHARNRRHHQSAFDPPELDDISWAGFQEWARQWLLLGRREKYDPSNGGSLPEAQPDTPDSGDSTSKKVFKAIPGAGVGMWRSSTVVRPSRKLLASGIAKRMRRSTTSY